eukprot:TRINITY_DN25759_c0_g1_i1.p1 TRINITY_DN25759_c0_g1~~TRINITY_DN25759_c0_g1_i1.p1  ORF type:complete len:166 (+),score=31.48 TRINITY_DN25759_c0_g1_i1:53-550(+)
MGLTSLRPGSANKEVSGSFTKKLDKKLHFYAKVRDTIVSLSAKKAISKKKRLRSRQKKLKAYDLSSLSELLPDLDASPKPPTYVAKLKLNGRSRQKLVEKESKQLQAVFNHPAFRADPLSAIHQHLQSTQPLPASSQEKRSGKTHKTAKRKNQSKVLSGSQSMDM